MTNDFLKVATIKGTEEFQQYLSTIGIDLPMDQLPLSSLESPIAMPIELFGKTAPNRFAIHPMEGWDGALDGKPTENTFRRWRRFGDGGAGLIWGGEAVAVRPDARANPNQLLMNAQNRSSFEALRLSLLDAYRETNGSGSTPVVGLQLTHSGRFSRPNLDGKMEPKILYRHPILDAKFTIPSGLPLLTDTEIATFVEDFVDASVRAQECGYDFVDIKHCHGYLGHEFLSAFTRPGPYGGSFYNRTRFMREIVSGIQRDAPRLGIGVRLSAFDLVPYEADILQALPGHPGPGLPVNYCDAMPYVYGFGINSDQPTEYDLAETVEFLQLLAELGVGAVNLSAGSPYYNPHIQRPALYPPSDGYAPPEDPLLGVAQQIYVVKYLKQLFPQITMVGSGYTYLQDFLPNVAQAVVREGWVDFVGLGRMALSHPQLPREILSGAPVSRKLVCRTFSDCTTAPRNGLISGCYPLDPHYKHSPEAQALTKMKKQLSAKATD